MKVAILGAGLQGCCVALELAARGVDVDLYDKSSGCMMQTSSHNEGKIHLGYVYANDISRNTARTMLQGALCFQSVLRRLLGNVIDTLSISDPFYYVVHRESLLSIEEVEAHLKESHAIALELNGELEPDYFGADFRQRPVRLSDEECAALYDTRTVTAAYRTEEVSIDSEALAAMVHERVVEEPKITFHGLTRILGVVRHDDGATVQYNRDGSADSLRYDHVVNTLWEGRLEIDETVGLSPSRPWLYRVKHYLRLQLPQTVMKIPSTTIILGAFGDAVHYKNGGLYLSWYPSGMLGSSSNISPPEWPNQLTEEVAHSLKESTLRELIGIVPALKKLPVEVVQAAQVKGGVIFAWGTTDIDDPHSGLHERYKIGPVSYGHYHSIDTGKLTMAPLFGRMLAEQIL